MEWIAFAKSVSAAACWRRLWAARAKGGGSRLPRLNLQSLLCLRLKTKVRLPIRPTRPNMQGQPQLEGATRCAQNQQYREVRMCRVFAGQDPEGYRQINRSIRIDGHSTSIQLEG